MTLMSKAPLLRRLPGAPTIKRHHKCPEIPNMLEKGGLLDLRSSTACKKNLRLIMDADVTSNGNAPVFMKAREMADQVGISPKTLTRWADAGHIDRFKPNPRLVLYSPENVMNYLHEANVIGNREVAK